MAINDRISSLDPGYKVGDLSIYPQGRDDYTSLYQATNNAQSYLAQSLSYTSTFVIVNDTSSFPANGLIRVGKEIIYYGSKTKTVFNNLIRGFVGSQQRSWPIGTVVQMSVMAEHHNAVRDAIVNIEANLGLEANPVPTSLNGILTSLEQTFLAPKPLFRAVPRTGAPPLMVHFQNFSDAPPLRFLWDFGDGSTSVETNPTHIYLAAGTYTVTLSMITMLGATGIATKSNYIVVNADNNLPFFYVNQLVGNTSTIFQFVDQSTGNITSRYWVWDDGTTDQISDPDIHTATHTYATPGQYSPNLLLVYADGQIERVGLDDTITVTS